MCLLILVGSGFFTTITRNYTCTYYRICKFISRIISNMLRNVEVHFRLILRNRILQIWQAKFTMSLFADIVLNTSQHSPSICGIIMLILLQSVQRLGRSVGPCKKYWFLGFCYPGPEGSGGPREVPLSHPWAFPVPPGASRRPPGPKTKQSQKLRNLK